MLWKSQQNLSTWVWRRWGGERLWFFKIYFWSLWHGENGDGIPLCSHTPAIARLLHAAGQSVRSLPRHWCLRDRWVSPPGLAICLFSSLKKLVVFYLLEFVIFPDTFQCLSKRNSNLLPNCFCQLFFVTCMNVEEAYTKNHWNKEWWRQVRKTLV